MKVVFEEKTQLEWVGRLCSDSDQNKSGLGRPAGRKEGREGAWQDLECGRCTEYLLGVVGEEGAF